MKMPLHLSTVLVRSASSLQSHIANLAKTFGNNNHTFLFALSTNIAQSSELSSLVQSLTNSIEGNTIGCLSRSVRQDATSCSFAIFDSERTTTFRSVIPGKIEPQVGRWHSFRDKNTESVPERTFEEGVAWADVWDGSSQEKSLPTELKHLRPSDVDTVLYLSDLAPEGLSNSLKAFPNATKLGLIAGSTPFITGRPVTLFHNRKIYSSGAVGLALKNSKTGDAQAVFEGAYPISAPMQISSCDGNMVNTLDGSNPTRLLLTAMEDSGFGTNLSGTFKDDEHFSLGVFDTAGKILEIYRITAGDPSRGSISLDSQRAPTVGTKVQFLHHPKSSVLESYKMLSRSTRQTLAFLTTPDDLDTSKLDEEDRVLQDTFLAASENGFILGRPAEDSWSCSIPGGMGLLQWGPKSTVK